MKNSLKLDFKQVIDDMNNDISNIFSVQSSVVEEVQNSNDKLKTDIDLSLKYMMYFHEILQSGSEFQNYIDLIQDNNRKEEQLMKTHYDELFSTCIKEYENTDKNKENSEKLIGITDNQRNNLIDCLSINSERLEKYEENKAGYLKTIDNYKEAEIRIQNLIKEYNNKAVNK